MRPSVAPERPLCVLTTSLKVRVLPGEPLLLLGISEQRGYEPWFSMENQGSLHLALLWRDVALHDQLHKWRRPLCFH